ncbi:hypothetical protein Pint_09126 [Pistacia integerrima]|uniref:Uncharacterized protein n=1 Tax=Pistacia integerrima TaxID=434235 RepID=A0ACC0XWK1_9ROSI|nr:hypothetical protein Pint_09126 [Pistacia integerrima]
MGSPRYSSYWCKVNARRFRVVGLGDYRPVDPKLVQKSSSHGLEIRAFELTFPNKYKDMVVDSYLTYLLKEAKSMKQESKSLKIFTLDPDYACFGFVNHTWVPVNLDHPATFDTLATEPDLKSNIVQDLERKYESFIGEYYLSIL